MSQKKWLDNHELFYKELQTGLKFQSILAEKLKEEGVPIFFKSIGFELDVNDSSETQYNEWLSARENIKAVRKKYISQDQDLLIGKNQIPCECKSRGVFFSGVDSFPYPDIFIDTVSGYGKKQVKPAYTFCISQKSEAIIYIESSLENAANWIKKFTYDKKRGIKELNYSAPKALWKDFSQFKKDFFAKYE
jgi:hypothetical protein